MMRQIGAIRKFVAALAGVAAIVVADGLVSGTAARWVTAALGALTALGVYVVPNSAGQGGAVEGQQAEGGPAGH